MKLYLKPTGDFFVRSGGSNTNPGQFMRMRSASAFALILTVGCQAGSAGGGDVALETDDQKASYAIGINIGTSLEAAGDHIQIDQLLAGIYDVREGTDPRLDGAEMQAVMAAFNQTVQTELMEQREADAQANMEEGAAFLATNADKEGIVTTDSGLQYEVLREGDGPQPTAEDRVTIHYKGTLIDGTEFDSSYGGTPATFAVNGVIPGFTEALLMMNVGSHYRVFIPGELGYGAQGSGPQIGPNAMLTFEIEMLEIAEQ